MANPILLRGMQQPFAEDLPSSRASSRAPSRASQSSSVQSRSLGIDDIALNIGDGTQHLEDIFNNITAGTTGPSLAKETVRASQHQQQRQQSHHQSRTHHQAHTTSNPVPPHRHNPPNLSREQEDFEAAQFALKQQRNSYAAHSGSVAKAQRI
ncbi:hypothetical protein PCANC_28490 [Puccinia coronata f. sp. avenae]|uniref:Uncharacterized protein n=1 Tax=Puccinia coronata f. sp. avenae TaxID=200324 RepID=A0A2N5TI91_9BASI|nr:hypothetical protein PCASD_19439 [Puccinia coronata f. sp. avenae]PLW25205.1 hypothetical protein PCANC_28490 [Puccinia coronata f. sp. avenae]